MEEFNKELDEMKKELNEVKLSDEFKKNLKIKMEEELNKPDLKEKARNVLFPRRLVATFACAILLITSVGVFADEIESLVSNIFSNTDKQIEDAIANGNYKEIDMEYVEHDGVGIKVDYIIQEENKLCIAFNVRCEEEFDKVYFDNIKLIDKINGNVIFEEKIALKINKILNYERRIDKKNSIYIYELYNVYEVKNILININSIDVVVDKNNIKEIKDIEIHI